jgi:hypothetical protein
MVHPINSVKRNAALIYFFSLCSLLAIGRPADRELAEALVRYCTADNLCIRNPRQRAEPRRADAKEHERNGVHLHAR